MWHFPQNSLVSHYPNTFAFTAKDKNTSHQDPEIAFLNVDIKFPRGGQFKYKHKQDEFDDSLPFPFAATNRALQISNTFLHGVSWISFGGALLFCLVALQLNTAKSAQSSVMISFLINFSHGVWPASVINPLLWNLWYNVSTQRISKAVDLFKPGKLSFHGSMKYVTSVGWWWQWNEWCSSFFVPYFAPLSIKRMLMR